MAHFTSPFGPTLRKEIGPMSKYVKMRSPRFRKKRKQPSMNQFILSKSKKTKSRKVPDAVLCCVGEAKTLAQWHIHVCSCIFSVFHVFSVYFQHVSHDFPPRTAADRQGPDAGRQNHHSALTQRKLFWHLAMSDDSCGALGFAFRTV